MKQLLLLPCPLYFLVPDIKLVFYLGEFLGHHLVDSGASIRGHDPDFNTI